MFRNVRMPLLPRQMLSSTLLGDEGNPGTVTPMTSFFAFGISTARMFGDCYQAPLLSGVCQRK